MVTRRGPVDAAEFVFRVFRRQQQERFLPGLEKLGLSHLPPAVAAAQYHYLSNWIGGVHVEYMFETDRKAWIRYPPPRWIWKGTAICGVPGEVSRAMLRGWHANNGVALGNARLGFVCTKQSVDGQDGLEGSTANTTMRSSRISGWCSPVISKPPCSMRRPRRHCRSRSWPKPRLEKAYRNYAMEYVRTAAPVMVQLFGPEDAGYLLHLTGKLIGMQFFDEVARSFAMGRGSAGDFAVFLRAVFEAQDDVADGGESGGAFEIRQQTWKLMADVADYHPACAKAARGIVRRPGGRLRPPHRGRHAACGGRCAAIRLVGRLARLRRLRPSAIPQGPNARDAHGFQA